eukprot:544958_1
MPYTTLADIKRRYNDNNSRNSKINVNNSNNYHRAQPTINNNTNNHYANWVSKAAIIGIILYLIIKSPWIWTLMSWSCIRDNNALQWKNDWKQISESQNFVDRCSYNAEISHDDTHFKGDHRGDLGKDPYFMEHTRCATTSYALINYFCGSNEIAENTKSTFYAVKHMIDNKQLNFEGNIKEIVLDYFIKTLNDTKSSQQSIYRLYIDQHFDKDHLGHVWVIQTLPNNTYHWYQSFIGKYTLTHWMKKKNNSFLNKRELLQRMELIRGIITTHRWSEKINNAYLRLFDVDYSHMIGKTISHSIIKGSGFDNTIKFDWSLDCYIGDNDNLMNE